MQEEIDTSGWSPTMKRIVELVGMQLTLKLVRLCGGRENAYIPITPRPDHPWAEAIGIEAFGQISAVFGGDQITLPMLKGLLNKKVLIIELLDQGLTTAEVARRVRSTPRYVRHVRASTRSI